MSPPPKFDEISRRVADLELQARVLARTLESVTGMDEAVAALETAMNDLKAKLGMKTNGSSSTAAFMSQPVELLSPTQRTRAALNSKYRRARMRGPGPGGDAA